MKHGDVTLDARLVFSGWAKDPGVAAGDRHHREPGGRGRGGARRVVDGAAEDRHVYRRLRLQLLALSSRPGGAAAIISRGRLTRAAADQYCSSHTLLAFILVFLPSLKCVLAETPPSAATR